VAAANAHDSQGTINILNTFRHRARVEYGEVHFMGMSGEATGETTEHALKIGFNKHNVK
jgi:hypothetical protein